ncbi:hypothetical protein [Natronomonas sp. LN261]|jgi:hypothetical protein|uniref:hypothetical protein n=1 Tax=Natronomonas sp. LN261 TaxID=2750669 RepID=UPI0015EF0AD8|nr:hypothetical protein [Natronomonas sp. LN261]
MPATEWRYDASTSGGLRFVSHFPVAGLGGAFLLAVGVGLVGVAASPGVLRSPFVLLFVLLALVGGPMSLLYLWPMLSDPDQRPSASGVAGGEGVPFTVRSVGVAAVSGSLAILALVAVDAPFGTVYRLVVGCVFSPVLVAAVTTEGTLDGGELSINRRTVPLERVTGVRSVRVRGLSVLWISYARRSGLFVPRLAVIPADADVEAVRAALETGIGADPDVEPPDRAVQAVAIGTGALFVAFGAFASVAVDEPAVGLYVAAVVGGLGTLLCLLGIRGG